MTCFVESGTDKNKRGTMSSETQSNESILVITCQDRGQLRWDVPSSRD